MSEKKQMLLSKVGHGSEVKLIEIDAGSGLKGRLAAMGLLPGVEFTVIKNGHPGPFVVKAKGTRMVLGRGMAQKITVEAKKN